MKLKVECTLKYKKHLFSALKYLNDTNMITEDLHRRMNPTCNQPPRFHGFPNVHKPTMPMQPIMSSICSIYYQNMHTT